MKSCWEFKSVGEVLNYLHEEIIMNAEEFFDKNDDFYGCLTPYKYDYFFIDFISTHTKKWNLLDIGGGVGLFYKNL